ncbi:hypothetical protein [Dasania marina]|uniref:hypothetical protein n=1 Tax=Dasania marina TaxID=471499 RepID=UPI0012EA9210|nr:hypothetical protein [Dasania marina]
MNQKVLEMFGRRYDEVIGKGDSQFSHNSKVLIGFSTDITERYELKESYQQQANTDALTGLFDRRCFFENADRG